MTERIRIGLAGKMRVGKTSVALYLKRTRGFHTAAFADPIKEFAKLVGWNGEKDSRGRELLQDIGTVVRKYDEKFWIRKMLADLSPEANVVVDDMRMLLEHEELTQDGFKTILIVRDPSRIHDAAEGTTEHVTEREVDSIRPWKTVTNNGNFEELYRQIDVIFDELTGKSSRNDLGVTAGEGPRIFRAGEFGSPLESQAAM